MLIHPYLSANFVLKLATLSNFVCLFFSFQHNVTTSKQAVTTAGRCFDKGNNSYTTKGQHLIIIYQRVILNYILYAIVSYQEIYGSILSIETSEAM